MPPTGVEKRYVCHAIYWNCVCLLEIVMGLLQIEIDDNYVRDRLSEVMSKTDLRKYIL
jgi:hypothetical protein